jgi:hypothetical protein
MTKSIRKGAMHSDGRVEQPRWSKRFRPAFLGPSSDLRAHHELNNNMQTAVKITSFFIFHFYALELKRPPSSLSVSSAPVYIFRGLSSC